MDRPVFTPKYEESESVIKSRMLGRIPSKWRKEPGDYMNDAVAPSPLEVKQLQINQDNILKNSFAQYAEGEFMDAKLAEVGLTRKMATPNKRNISVIAVAGVVIPKGYTLSQVILDNNGNPLLYYTDEAVTFIADATVVVPITCATAGRIGNIPTSSQLILQPPIPGISQITDGGTTIPGTDKETDAEAWDRYFFKVNNPDTGGNRYDYIRWSQEVTGVGKVKIIPIWDGGGTVKIILTDTEGLPASNTLKNEVQDYLDPDAEGLGEGKAPCGSVVTVVAAINLAINIEATVTYSSTVDENIVKAKFEQALAAYLKEIIFTDNPVAFVKVGALLIGTQGVVNYADLTVNGGTIDVAVAADEVATLGTVDI